MTQMAGYCITQYPKKNQIVITLPQRWDTLTNTFVPISDRRIALTDTEEATLLAAVKAMFENGSNMEDAQEVRHGQWIMHINDLFPAESTMECDQCHEEQPLECDDKYCPNCGVKMDKEE